MEKTEYVLSSSGTITRRQIHESEITVLPGALEALGDERILRMQGVAKIAKNHLITLSCNNKMHVWSTNLDEIPIRAQFKVMAQPNGNKVATPSFDPKDPTMEGIWLVPEAMRVFFLTVVGKQPPGWQAGKSYLIAVDSLYVTYTLPLPNTYEDGSLCLGDYDTYSDTSLEAFHKSYDQFGKAKWNADLMGQKLANCNRMFLFDIEKMQSLPVAQDIWKYCTKISTGITQWLWQ